MHELIETTESELFKAQHHIQKYEYTLTALDKIKEKVPGVIKSINFSYDFQTLSIHLKTRLIEDTKPFLSLLKTIDYCKKRGPNIGSMKTYGDYVTWIYFSSHMDSDGDISTLELRIFGDFYEVAK